MEKMDFSVTHALANAYKAIPANIGRYALSLLAFSLIISLFYVLVESRGKKRSLPNALSLIVGRKALRSASARVDFWHFLALYFLWTPIITTISTLVLGISLNDVLIEVLGRRPPITDRYWIILAIQFASIYLGSDFGFYVIHVMLHKIDVLWALHRAHHSAEDLNIFTPGRFHPVEALMNALGIPTIAGVVTGLALYTTGTDLLPESARALGVYASISIFLTLFHHSNVWLPLGWLDYVVAGPVMHQIHHSAELRHRDKNLGATLMIFDGLFGTRYVPKEREKYRHGLNDNELGEGNPHNRLRDFYLDPLVSMCRVLARRIAGLFTLLRAGNRKRAPTNTHQVPVDDLANYGRPRQ